MGSAIHQSRYWRRVDLVNQIVGLGRGAAVDSAAQNILSEI